MTETQETLSHLIDAIESLEIADSVPIGNAHFIPILQKDPEQPRDYITAHEALEQGLLELRDSGRIEAVVVINKATVPVLFIAGMDIHGGGTQSRIIVGSHLVPPKAEIELPCRCTHDVHPIRRYHSMMTDVEHYSVASPGVRGPSLARSAAGQDRVWKKVREYRKKLKTCSVEGKTLLDKEENSTRLSDLQGKAVQNIQKTLKQVQPLDHQVGLALISEGQLQTIEVFDNPETYHHFHRHLLERFAFEIAAPKPTSKKKLDSIRDILLQELRRLSQRLNIEKGKGSIQSKGKILGTLQNKDKKLIHLCLEKL